MRSPNRTPRLRLLAIAALVAGKVLGWVWMDPLMGLVGAGIILAWSVRLLRESSRILLDGDVEPDLIDRLRAALEVEAGDRVADIHLWRVGPTQLAAIVSMVDGFVVGANTFNNWENGTDFNVRVAALSRQTGDTATAVFDNFKAQTITNIIAHSLANNRSVLFVSEKMAALNVVHHRLSQCGLEPFCLELHSSKVHKRHVIEQIGQALDHLGTPAPGDWEREAQRLEKARGSMAAAGTAKEIQRSISRRMRSRRWLNIIKGCPSPGRLSLIISTRRRSRISPTRPPAPAMRALPRPWLRTGRRWRCSMARRRRVGR